MLLKSKLTKQEHCVLTLLNQGAPIKSIAKTLAISPYTVSGYMKSIYLKLNVNSRAEAQYKINISHSAIANKEKSERAAELASALAYARAADTKLEECELQLLSVLNAFSKARDDETGNHILRTQHYVKLLALRLRANGHYSDQLSDIFIDIVFKAAPLHDIGKIAIPDAILLKTTSLTEAEWAIMKTHTLIGESILDSAGIKRDAGFDVISKAILIAGSHHEKWNGTGYPRGLAGIAIPLEARIMSLADMYDALVSKRSYKKAWSHEQAAQEIISRSGSYFEPVIVEAFIAEQASFWEIGKKYQDELCEI